MGLFWAVASYRFLLFYKVSRSADRSSLPAVGVSIAEDHPCAVRQPSNPTERAGESKKHSVRKLSSFIEPEGCHRASRHRTFETSALIACFTTSIGSWPSTFRDNAAVQTLRNNPDKRRSPTQHFFAMFNRTDSHT